MSGMNSMTQGARSLMILGGLGLAVGLSACAHVNEDDLNTQLADLREEMQQGDEANSQEIGQVDQRVGDLEGRLGDLEQEIQSLEQDFNTTVQRLETALRFSTPVHFGFDETEIRPEDEEYLDRFASVVEEYYSDAIVTVEGFTDPAGSEAYNQQLGQQRADAVRSYLTDNAGMTGDRIRAVSYGENTERLIDPQASGPGDTGMSNRRVVLVIDNLESPPMETESQPPQDDFPSES